MFFVFLLNLLRRFLPLSIMRLPFGMFLWVAAFLFGLKPRSRIELSLLRKGFKENLEEHEDGVAVPEPRLTILWHNFLRPKLPLDNEFVFEMLRLKHLLWCLLFLDEASLELLGLMNFLLDDVSEMLDTLIFITWLISCSTVVNFGD